MVTVTEKAKNQITRLMSDGRMGEDYHLRVAVTSGGCSGLSYNLDFDNKNNEGDLVFEDKGVKIAVDKKSLLYVAGTELDFSDGLNGKGFQFKNPNATRTCSCGESFAV
ncbi:MAG: heme biosynthesis protein HemY [Bacteroidetes bacterium RIFCSPLOWO2_12_FULL_37_12]|nr:MAG: heme biosynthesis protein HemY [Bacteroidetes bacterium RIFCSPLOWO2_12_FULL_37_12]